MHPLTSNDPLAVFVAKVGGINPHYAKDMRHGEILRITEARRGLPPGAINHHAPLTLEEIASRAYETGYTWNEEIDTFLDALEQDVAAKNNNDPKKRVYTWESDRRYQLLTASQEAESESPMSAAVTAMPITTTEDDLRAQIAALKAQNAQLTEAQRKKVSLKVSEKGGVSVYGLSKWPITHYKSQWITLLDMKDTIVQFMSDHDSELSVKE